MDNEKMVRFEEGIKQINKNLESHDKKIERLEQTYSIMENLNYRMENVENSVKSIDNKLDKNMESKIHKWDKFIDYLFYAIMAYVLFKLGLKG